MDKGFRKFKQKIRFSAIVRAVLMGVSLGIIAVAVQWLLAKLAPADPDFVQYGLIGGGIALVASAAFAFFMLPTDKRLAKRLDNKLQMHEKVQTMVAFRKDESEMAKLQRENAQELLMQTPTKKARSKSAWLSMILPVLACACLVVTILIPAQAETPENPEENTGWFLSVFDENKLNDLIKYVQTSQMQDVPKQGIVAELEDLLKELKVITKKVVMQEAVVDTIKQIHQIAKPYHTHAGIIEAMSISTSQNVVALSKKVATLNGSTISSGMNDLLPVLNVENKVDVAAKMAAEIEKALQSSGETEENLLYKAYADFALALKAVTAENTEQDLKNMLKKCEDSLVLSVVQVGHDVSVEKYTINRLMAIFGIPATDIPSDIINSFNDGDISGNPQDPDADSDEENVGSGGAGPGEMKYGSDDTIYDPIQDMQVPYGEVITEYQTVIYSLIMEGEISPELEEMLTDYLAILYRPINKG